SGKTVHVIPLRDVWKGSRLRRTRSAMRLLREYVKRHMKAKRIIISNRVSELVWSRGVQNPPRRLRVELVREDEETVAVRLEGEGAEEE
ncbi:MAG: 50S ribosomal protein L31e, partial [Nitrososphaerota archaeon]